jgi:HlyD family secretion protein
MVLRDRLIEAEVAASDARERLAALEEEELRLDLDAIERESQQRLALLDEKLAVEDQEREVRRLTARLDAQQVVRSSHDGRIAEVKVNPGDVVQSGTPLATLAPTDEEDLVGVLYVPPAQGKRVQPGMTTEISPTTVEREVYGHILGEVVSVAPLPATAEGMRRTLQNDQLVTQLSAEGAPIEVRIRLQRDDGTATRFAWSSSDGPDNGVNGGTLIEGRIVIERLPLIDLIVPGATKKLAVLD